MLAGLLMATEAGAQGQGHGKPGANCPDATVAVTFRDDTADSVQSDGGPYMNGALSCGGLSWATESGRSLRFSLQAPTDAGNSFTLDSMAGANLGVLVSAEDSEAGGVIEMPVGASMSLVKVQFNFVTGGKRYFLQWGSNYPGTSTATITRTATDIWVIETSAAPNNIANLKECDAHAKCKSPVNRTYYAPLKMTLVR